MDPPDKPQVEGVPQQGYGHGYAPQYGAPPQQYGQYGAPQGVYGAPQGGYPPQQAGGYYAPAHPVYVVADATPEYGLGFCLALCIGLFLSPIYLWCFLFWAASSGRRVNGINTKFVGALVGAGAAGLIGAGWTIPLGILFMADDLDTCYYDDPYCVSLTGYGVFLLIVGVIDVITSLIFIGAAYVLQTHPRHDTVPLMGAAVVTA